MAEVQTINIPQRFDFSHHKPFTEQYQKFLDEAECKKIVMDFSRTEYLDSSALGMMVLLNKKAKGVGKQVTVRGAKDNTKEILVIANFDKLFPFE
ncbi:MAG: STAS domain-containing protein [Aliiglaciecola sp.]